MPEPAYKRCTKCGEAKPMEDFPQRMKRGKRRHVQPCKVCKAAVDKAWRADNREHSRQWEREYRRAKPEAKAAKDRRYAERHPEKVRANQDRHRERNPEKHRARCAVNNAIRDGRMIKPSVCDSCGEKVESPRLHAHHEDYSKPLDVRWFCRGCHWDLHRTK